MRKGEKKTDLIKGFVINENSLEKKVHFYGICLQKGAAFFMFEEAQDQTSFSQNL